MAGNLSKERTARKTRNVSEIVAVSCFVKIRRGGGQQDCGIFY
jgi:3-deoxy-D-arabino-heptulosonate 7-phosphate (DAHP) synthase class II